VYAIGSIFDLVTNGRDGPGDLAQVVTGYGGQNRRARRKEITPEIKIFCRPFWGCAGEVLERADLDACPSSRLVEIDQAAMTAGDQ